MNSNDLTQAFNKIYDDTYSTVLNLVISKCDNISNIEDIVQDVYSELYETMIKKGIDYVKNYNAFIYVLTKNKIFKYYNVKNKFKNLFISNKENLTEDYYEKEIEDRTNYEEEFLNKYTYESIYEQIKKMDLVTQKIIILYYMQDLRLDDISKVLEINSNTVKTKLYRGLEKLKNKFNNGGE